MAGLLVTSVFFAVASTNSSADAIWDSENRLLTIDGVRVQANGLLYCYSFLRLLLGDDGKWKIDWSGPAVFSDSKRCPVGAASYSDTDKKLRITDIKTQGGFGYERANVQLDISGQWSNPELNNPSSGLLQYAAPPALWYTPSQQLTTPTGKGIFNFSITQSGYRVTLRRMGTSSIEELPGVVLSSGTILMDIYRGKTSATKYTKDECSFRISIEPDWVDGVYHWISNQIGSCMKKDPASGLNVFLGSSPFPGESGYLERWP